MKYSVICGMYGCGHEFEVFFEKDLDSLYNICPKCKCCKADIDNFGTNDPQIINEKRKTKYLEAR